MPESSQLPLAFFHPPEYGRDSFVPGDSNRDALALIERWPDWPSPLVVLSGPAGSGKTHLAHIWAERAKAEMVRLAHLRSEHFDISGQGALAIEDIDAGSIPEQTLFHLINGIREAGTGLLLTARNPASAWPIGLADLRSRLRMATPARLDRPDDDLLRKLLVKLFSDRQLMVEKPVIDYLLLRMERSLKAAVVLVEGLDREALAAGRSITRPMAARILAGEPGEGGEFADPQ